MKGPMKGLAKYLLMVPLLMGAGQGGNLEAKVEAVKGEMAAKAGTAREEGVKDEGKGREKVDGEISWTKNYFPQKIFLDAEYGMGFLGGRYTKIETGNWHINPQAFSIEVLMKREGYSGLWGGSFRTEDKQEKGIYLKSHILENRIYVGGGYDFKDLGLGTKGNLFFAREKENILPGIEAGVGTVKDIIWKNLDFNWLVNLGLGKRMLYAEGKGEAGYNKYFLEGGVKVFDNELSLGVMPGVEHDWGPFLAWVGGEVFYKGFKGGEEIGFLTKVGLKVKDYRR